MERRRNVRLFLYNGLRLESTRSSWDLRSLLQSSGRSASPSRARILTSSISPARKNEQAPALPAGHQLRRRLLSLGNARSQRQRAWGPTTSGPSSPGGKRVVPPSHAQALWPWPIRRPRSNASIQLRLRFRLFPSAKAICRPRRPPTPLPLAATLAPLDRWRFGRTSTLGKPEFRKVGSISAPQQSPLPPIASRAAS